MVAPSPCLYTGQVTRSRSVDAAARLHTPLHGPPQETGNIGVKHPSGYWMGFHFISNQNKSKEAYYRSIRDDLLKKVVRELLLLAAYYRFLAYYRSIRDSLT